MNETKIRVLKVEPMKHPEEVMLNILRESMKTTSVC